MYDFFPPFLKIGVEEGVVFPQRFFCLFEVPPVNHL